MVFLGFYKILKTNITVCDYAYILKKIDKHLKSQKRILLSPISSHSLVQAYFNSKLEQILNLFDYLLPDSHWICKSIHLLHGIRLNNRVSGPELMRRLCEIAQHKKYKIFLYGTTQNTLNLLRKKLEFLYPKLQIIGSFPSKFRDLSLKEKQEIINIIEKSRADILLIAMGSPLQEIFSYNILYGNPHIQKPIAIIPVGAAFDFISGVKPQAPKWMQESGLEWLFRLICEPKRLWKRYLIYGPIFILLVILQKLLAILKNHE